MKHQWSTEKFGSSIMARDMADADFPMPRSAARKKSMDSFFRITASLTNSKMLNG